MIQPLVSATTRAAIDKLGDTYNPASGAVSAASGGAPSVDQAGETGQASFAQVLADAAGGTVGKLENAEALSMRKMSGEDVPIRDVVNAVMDAEQSLSTAIAIRDKIVQAYLEISRMQI